MNRRICVVDEYLMGFLEAELLGRALHVDDLLTTFDTPYQVALAD